MFTRKLFLILPRTAPMLLPLYHRAPANAFLQFVLHSLDTLGCPTVFTYVVQPCNTCNTYSHILTLLSELPSPHFDIFFVRSLLVSFHLYQWFSTTWGSLENHLRNFMSKRRKVCLGRHWGGILVRERTGNKISKVEICYGRSRISISLKVHSFFLGLVNYRISQKID